MFKEKRLSKGHGKVMLSDELTIYEADELKTKLAKYAEPEKCKSMTIDMSDVVEIDTSCIQILMQLKQEFNNADRDLKIVSHSPAVIEIFDLYNLGSFFGDPMVLAS